MLRIMVLNFQRETHEEGSRTVELNLVMYSCSSMHDQIALLHFYPSLAWFDAIDTIEFGMTLAVGKPIWVLVHYPRL